MVKMGILGKIKEAITKAGQKLAHAFGMVTQTELKQILQIERVEMRKEIEETVVEKYAVKVRKGREAITDWWKDERKRRKAGKKGRKPTEKMIRDAGS